MRLRVWPRSEHDKHWLFTPEFVEHVDPGILQGPDEQGVITLLGELYYIVGWDDNHSAIIVEKKS